MKSFELYFTLAWRNILRNPRRALFTLSAIVIAVTSSNFFAALQKGMSEQLVRSAVNTISGNLQVHSTKYLNDPSIDYLFELKESQLKNIDGKWVSRLRVPAVINSERESSSIILLGVDPLKEKDAGFIPTDFISGNALESSDSSTLLIGSALAKKMQTKLGRRVVVMSMGVDGELKERGFKISGVFQTPLGSEEKEFIFSGGNTISNFLGVTTGVSELAVRLSDESDPLLLDNEKELKSIYPSHDVKNWRQLKPLVHSIVQVQDGILLIWYLIVMLTVAFGLVNTLFMAIFERIREIGLYRALGMTKLGVISGVIIECIYLLIIGVVLGNLTSIFIVFMFSGGIDLSQFAKGTAVFGISKVVYPKLEFGDVLTVNFLILIIGSISSAYPAWKAGQLLPAEGLSKG